MSYSTDCAEKVPGVGLSVRVVGEPWYRIVGWAGMPVCSAPETVDGYRRGPVEVTSDVEAWRLAR